MTHAATRLFPLWAILFSGVAYALPELFAPLKPSIIYLLGVVMFGMGMSLQPSDFSVVFKKPSIVVLGVLLQFGLMPLLAWGISEWMELSLMLTAGMILVGASPGGTASNVICYLARGNVALSISLTAISTVLAVILTSFLTLLYAGQKIDVPAMKMLRDVLNIVLLPVLAGVGVNLFFGRMLAGLQRIFPLISVMAIVLIIAIIVALNQPQLANLALPLVGAVALHNGLGLLLGYGIPKLMKLDERSCRTLAIEVGMQNSGLAVALAIKYFSSAAALPGAIFSLWHNLSGSLLASFWSRQKYD